MSINQPSNGTTPNEETMRRLVALVLELGSEEEGAPRKGRAARSFARTQILIHAMSMFNQQGLEDTSVQDLLEAANISRRTFYKYFTSKLDVLESIYVLASKVMLARFEAELQTTSSREELLNAFVHIYFDYQFSVGKIVGIMLEESLRAASPLAPHRQQLLNKVVVVLQREFSRLGLPAQEYWRLMGLLWALEGASVHLLTNPLPPVDDVDACRRGMLLLWQKGIEA